MGGWAYVGAQTNQSTRARSRSARAFVVFWALGVGFAWWAVVPALMALGSKVKLKAGAESKLLVTLGLWLFGSLAASVVGGAVVANRIPGAAYGAIVWVAAGIMFHVLRKLTPEQNNFFIRGLIFIGSLQGLLTLVAVTVHPSPLSVVAFPASSVISQGSGVGAWVQANLAYFDYFGGGIVRSSGMMATAAWSGGYACLVLILLLLSGRRLRGAGMSRAGWLVAVAFNLSSLYFSYSRVSMAILGGVVAVYLIYRAWAVADRGGLVASMTVLIGAVLMFTLTPWQDYVLEQDSLRPGSSGARMTSYVEGFSAASDSGFLVLIAGNGAKPFLEDLGRGAGSESTYVSLLVRGGIVALSIFVIFLLARLGRAFRARDWVGVLLLLALAVHAVVEDLDVGTLTLLLALIEPTRVALTPKEERGPTRKRRSDDLPDAYRLLLARTGGQA